MRHPKLTTHNLPPLVRKISEFFSCCRWLAVGCLWLPLLASAGDSITIFDTPDTGLNFTALANKISDIANAVIPFLIGVAFVATIWGVFKYVRNAGDVEKVAEGRKAALYGVIALFLMLSFWGFVMIIKKSLFG